MPNSDQEALEFLGQLAAQHQMSSSSTTSSWGGTAYQGPYAAGRLTKTTTMWQPEHRSGSGAITDDWWLMTARFRDALRNDPHCRKAVQALVTLCIKDGIHTFADVETSPGVED